VVSGTADPPAVFESEPMSQNRLPPKKEVALALLESSTVFLHLDPRVEEVKVPPWFKRQPQLVLQIGLNMPVPIHDLNLDESGVSCTLSFNRAPHFCHVPWKAIYALVAEDGRGMLWPEDIPPEVSAQAHVRAQAQEPRTHLHAVPAAAKAAEARPEPIRANSRGGQRADAEQPAKKRTRRKPRREDGATPARATRGRRPALAPVEPPKPAAAARPAAQASASKTGDEAPRKKRELPPYLRIVK
jgi:stringent starvation protein B